MASPGDVTLIDSFRPNGGWRIDASDQVEAHWRADARGHCLDYDFNGVSGYAVARRTLPPVDLPPNYEYRLRVRGHGPANHFQFKLTDASGDNVWWVNRPDMRFGARPRELRFKRRQIQFAWGPTADKVLRHPEALELVVATGSGGGQGSVCFERLDFVERAPPPAAWPAPRLTVRGTSAAVDFGLTREFSGLQLHWPSTGQRPRDYTIDTQDEAGRWRRLAQVRRGAGPLDALFLPEREARRLRITAASGEGTRAGLAALRIEPVEPGAWRSQDDATAARAKRLPPGLYPRTYLGDQNYWTLFGVDGGGGYAALLSEDGAVEPAPGSPSIEPFVLLEGDSGNPPTLVGWADVKISHSLPEGYLPQPRVRWAHPAFTLDIDAGASGDGTRPTGHARYTLRAAGERPLKATLLLVARPWQVNPPQQFLNQPGGASPLSRVAWQDGLWHLNDRLALRPTPAPARAWAGGGADWPVAFALTNGAPVQALREAASWRDAEGRAESALAYPLQLPAGGDAQLALSWRMTGVQELPPHLGDVNAGLAASAEAWRERLNRVGLQLPAAGQRVHDTLRSALAQILLSRRGAALQPGTRSYARSWVRDGAMMVAGLLRLGETEASREFVDWYATQLFASGKVPCCVDARGADPVPENDSHGQFVYSVAELWRFTHDRTRLQRHWPAVQRAVRYMEQLRQSERTPANRQPGREAFYGLMPASISHEGYSEKAMHSYWDDFWALRGYNDAVLLAQAVGDEAAAREFAGWRDEFAAELAASIRAAAAQHRIDFMPGAAELGDFDATSTTVALNPAQAQALLPPGLLDATFERYWRESQQRTRGKRAWKDYTPYELRSVGALVRLQQPERALAMLDFFFADQRPAGWNQWAEVVMRDPREIRFLGDMPHAWVASDAIRSLLDLFVHDDGDGLVLAAGLPQTWLNDGVAVRDLPTPHGRLSYRARREAEGLHVEIDAGLDLPPGGLRWRWQGGEQRIDSLPASLTLADRAPETNQRK
ncbi:MAG TPA: hypothetical protein VFY73_05770 [Ideonella sp.]|uniref:hypothetical protein n=1 Tax=Ideonella sp. TaxID=1929293 RepID=UPI002E2ED672|nr:hypothetical protein [Ideonella sp.]HEX5683528.1 hypothetical protein [Ideonella sp.]